MANVATHDMESNLIRESSIVPGTALSGTTPAAGANSKDFEGASGPVHGLFHAGAPTGTPDSFAIAVKLQESATGTSDWTDMAGDRAAASVTAGSTVTMLVGRRTKKYCRVHATPAFTGGSSPTLPCSATLLAQKQNVT